MAGFTRIKTFGDAFESGKTLTSTFRKAPAQANNAGWYDLSMTAGNPPPNYYAATPLEATTLEYFKGILHGDNKSPEKKFLTNIELTGTIAGMVGEYRLLDYLLFYPFVDGDELSAQAMVNTTPLPRYTTGTGVQAMLVGVTPSLGGGTFTFDYTNQDGAAKTSPVINCSSAAQLIGTIATGPAAVAGSSFGPFLPLAAGDSGIRSVESVTFTVAAGALYSLVLVKPLLTHAIREINIPNENNLVRQTPFLPEVTDGAYLNLIVNAASTLSGGFLIGNTTYAWS